MLHIVNRMANLLGDEIFGKMNDLEWNKKCTTIEVSSVCEENGE